MSIDRLIRDVARLCLPLPDNARRKVADILRRIRLEDKKNRRQPTKTK